MQKARRDLNASDTYFLIWNVSHVRMHMQCKDAEPEPEPLGQLARSRSQSRILKVGRLQLRERLSATHIRHIEQRQA